MAEPPITIMAAHMSAGSNLPVTRIVIHATCPDVGYPAASKVGAASGTAKYFSMLSSGGSAHYVEGVDSEQHCVPDDRIAWHAPPNLGSLGIEITADGGGAGAFKDPSHAYTREQWLSDAVWPAVKRAADRCRELCERFNVPKVRLSSADVAAGKHGICGHVNVSEAFGQSDHTDPGPNFPWDEFIALVTGTTTAPVQEDDDMLSQEAQDWIEGRLDAHDAYVLANLKATIGRQVATQTAQLAAYAAAVQQGGADPSVIQAAADKAVAEFVARLNDAGAK